MVVIALGSNLGDRHSHLQFARQRLATLLDAVQFSSVIETAPVGVNSPQSDYLNQVAVGSTSLAPVALLARLQAVESERGRARPFPNAPRTLDLDMILYGDAIIDHDGLIVPHPRFRERRFVLEPLSEVAPNLRDPVTGRTVQELLEQLSNQERSDAS